ncbi:MAG: methylenetetrahydrofolate reductase [NAD(P)H] [Bergeyella sp.]|nr:methylenetetrahydrofolate reductase [NAD(P)H] [Bergeyella sp.]
MKITDHIKKSKGKTLFSFEIIPPQKGVGISDLYKSIDPLMELKPSFIDVTSSREEYVFIERGGGLMERKITKMRPGTLGICAAIQHKYNVDTVPHVLCGGFTREETEYLLVDCMYLGIHNIMALRGDAMKGEKYFEPKAGGHHYASDLVKQIYDLGTGKYLHGEILSGEKNSFCIGVAGYPEKHIEAPSIKYDIEMLKKKVKAGADYIVTQMFFDNQKFFEFVDEARKAGIAIPILPGLKPIATKNHLKILPQIFKIDLPETLVNEVLKSKSNAEAREIGTRWSIDQSKELLKFGVPVLHFYSMGKSDNLLKIGKEIF